MTDEDQLPILVVVENGSFTCYGLGDAATDRDNTLMALLQEENVIGHSTPDGKYYFNANEKGYYLDSAA